MLRAEIRGIRAVQTEPQEVDVGTMVVTNKSGSEEWGERWGQGREVGPGEGRWCAGEWGVGWALGAGEGGGAEATGTTSYTYKLAQFQTRDEGIVQGKINITSTYCAREQGVGVGTLGQNGMTWEELGRIGAKWSKMRRSGRGWGQNRSRTRGGGQWPDAQGRRKGIIE
ncbi:hypothetical protein Droror1_Dr00020500 [Drosera rotundifolia]